MPYTPLPPFPSFASLRILLLEDNEMERIQLAALLRRMGVGQVEQAASGDDALALVQADARPFDVVLCDLQIKERDRMDGVEFLRVAANRLPCPLVLLSGIDEDLALAAESLAVACGATWGGRLRKPIMPAELHAVLSACTERTAGTPAADTPPARGRDWSAGDVLGALARGEFVPWFQPQVCLATRRLYGVEALARWHHPDAGIIGPAQFVPLMEREGLVDALFDAMLDGALAAMGTWNARGMRVPVSINASPLTLENVDVPNRWRRRVEAHGIDPGLVTIEVTETAVARNFHGLLESVTRLRMHGFRVALDDFGTSYSSLQQLSELPATEVKIDRTFVDRALRYPRARVILESIVHLGRKLGMTIVAEGVETQAQSDFVRMAGCDAAQGWLHGRPAPAAALQAGAGLRPEASHKILSTIPE